MSMKTGQPAKSLSKDQKQIGSLLTLAIVASVLSASVSLAVGYFLGNERGRSAANGSVLAAKDEARLAIEESARIKRELDSAKGKSEQLSQQLSLRDREAAELNKQIVESQHKSQLLVKKLSDLEKIAKKTGDADAIDNDRLISFLDNPKAHNMASVSASLSWVDGYFKNLRDLRDHELATKKSDHYIVGFRGRDKSGNKIDVNVAVPFDMEVPAVINGDNLVVRLKCVVTNKEEKVDFILVCEGISRPKK